MELSEATKKLIRQYKLARQLETKKPEAPTIHVDEVALRVAAFYEQMRTIVEWKEEHLMRRAAIIRKLKKKFFDLEINNFSDTKGAAESLVLELIRGGHFLNDKIEEPKIADVQKALDKYVFILKNNPENKQGKAGLQFYSWLVEVCACEVEDALAPAIREMALINYMFDSMKEKIKVSDAVYEAGLMAKPDKDTQIFIAVCQSLFKLDKPIISYHLIKRMGANCENIFKIWRKIENDLANPVANKFYAVCEKYDTPYLLMGDVLMLASGEEEEKDIANPGVFEQLIKESYAKRLSTLKSRIARAAVYSTVSIFLTKVLSLLVLELAIEQAMGGKINPMVLTADVMIPTFLMLAIVSTARKPSKKNLNIVTIETIKLAYKKDTNDVYPITARKKKGFGMAAVLSFIYVLSAVITFGAIFYIFNLFGFPATSIIINIIFIALILFAGTAVQKRSQELTMEEEKEGFLSFLSDVFFLPVHGLGRWIANKWKKYNAVAAFLNAMIDIPFISFVEFLEKWRYFVKDKKEEIR